MDMITLTDITLTNSAAVITALAIFAVVAVSAASLMVARSCRKSLRIMRSDYDKQIRMTASSVLGMGNRVLELESRLSMLKEDQKTLSDTQQDFAYSKAKKLIAQGLSVDAVAASAGLSHSEIELIKLIHGNERSTAEAV